MIIWNHAQTVLIVIRPNWYKRFVVLRYGSSTYFKWLCCNNFLWTFGYIALSSYGVVHV